MDHQSSLSVNPNYSREMRFAFRFMGALARIKRSTTTRQQAPQRCSRRIKQAADASMATAIGYRRRWGRALIFKLHNQAKRRRACLVRRRKVLSIGRHDKEKKPMTKIKKKKIDIGYGGGDGGEENKVLQSSTGGDDHDLVTGKADRLRGLVPGGETMDFCKLLEETSHYIKCLNTQVQVMKSIADIYTSSTTTPPSTKT